MIVEDIAAQEATVELLKGLFENTAVVDRRKQPSHGYRAVHVIVNCLGTSVEIQVRTQLQHLWAELSEKFSDVINPAIKYGGGDARIQNILMRASNLVGNQEHLETSFADDLPGMSQQEIGNRSIDMDNRRELVLNGLREMVEELSNF